MRSFWGARISRLPKRAIQQIVGNDVYVVDGGAGAARELRRLLEAKNERRKENRIGKIEFLKQQSRSARN